MHILSAVNPTTTTGKRPQAAQVHAIRATGIDLTITGYPDHAHLHHLGPLTIGNASARDQGDRYRFNYNRSP